jgi:hypothetical protein
MFVFESRARRLENVDMLKETLHVETCDVWENFPMD